MILNMKPGFKKYTVEVICLLYILLFVYAAVSKLLDFENFQVQLGQSPLLSAFTFWVSWIVPLLEITIATVLLSKKFRILGLLGAFWLMTIFSVYIFIVINYSSSIPCSCGGILEKMSWDTHLAFNIVFVLLALFAIVLSTSITTIKYYKNRRRIFILLCIVFVCSVVTVIGLFLLSEDISKSRNNFIRRFAHHPIIKVNQRNLNHSSFYFAGLDKKTIYLGNHVAPLHVFALDTNLKRKDSFVIKLSQPNLSFRSVQVRVQPPYFYFMDGTVPCIFKGEISNWNAFLWIHNKAYFSKIEALNPTTFAIRAISSKSHENILGILKIDDSIKVQLEPQILKKQIDGIFDTDGVLLFNYQFQKIIYIYYYRNEYLINDLDLKNTLHNHTIDTISKAQIKVAHIKSKNQSKLSAPPVIVNRNATTYGNYLFVNSGIIGRYENKDMWKKASIIDVYNFRKNTYLFSFYIPNLMEQKMTDFRIIGNILIVLYDQILVTYSIKKQFL